MDLVTLAVGGMVLGHREQAAFVDFLRRDQFHKSLRISRAALYPGAPMTPPPGCAPDPHRYRPGTGVRYRAQPATGRMENIWSRLISPWKMLPPVMPNRRSRSSGVSVCLSMIIDRMFGAYSSITSSTRSEKGSRRLSQFPSRRV